MKTLIIVIICISGLITFNNTYAGSVSSFPDLLTGYISVKNALVSDNSSEASASAAGLLDLIRAFDSSSLNETESSAWKKHSADIELQTKLISESDNIDKQRDHFSSLSTGMYSLLITFKGNTSDLYYQFCPMANDGDGAYWISELSKIKNPYYGKKMMACGETKKKIKAE